MSFVSGLQTSSQHSASSAFSAPQMGSQNYLSRVPSLPETVYGSTQLYPHIPGLRTDGTGYYPTHAGSDSRKAASSLGQHYFVDQMMNPHPYSAMFPGFDMNAIRRKNATRETTGPLKAWLTQHKKNPYPTKGEKVMLAIATRMTLTQVSTWFANARRRMKKDNIGEYDDNTEGNEKSQEIRDRSGSLSSRMSRTSSEADTSKELSDLSDIEEKTINEPRPVKKCVQRLFSPEIRTEHIIDTSSSPESLPEKLQVEEQTPEEHRLPSVTEMIHSRVEYSVPAHATESSDTVKSQKSRIWSISEIIGSASKTINTENASSCAVAAVNPDQYGPYDNSVYQSQLIHAYSNYYSATQARYKYDYLNALNTSSSDEITATDSKESIQYL